MFETRGGEPIRASKYNVIYNVIGILFHDFFKKRTAKQIKLEWRYISMKLDVVAQCMVSGHNIYLLILHVLLHCYNFSSSSLPSFILLLFRFKCYILD